MKLYSVYVNIESIAWQSLMLLVYKKAFRYWHLGCSYNNWCIILVDIFFGILLVLL